LTPDYLRCLTIQDTPPWPRCQLSSSKTCFRTKYTCLTVFQRCTSGSDLSRINSSTTGPTRRAKSTSKTFLTREWKNKLSTSTCTLVVSHRCSRSSSHTGLIHTQSITGKKTQTRL
jgi:hypothetical protein